MLKLTEAVEEYLLDMSKARSLADTTLTDRRCILGLFARWCDREGLDLGSLGSVDVERWLSSMRVCARTKRNRLSQVRTLYGWARRRGYVAHDPTEGVPQPRVSRSVPRALPAASVARLLAAAPTSRDRLIVSLMVQEGLRCCEVANLRVADVDRETGELLATGKGGHQRMLPLTASTARCLDAYLAESPAPGFGFVVRKYREPLEGLKPNWISRVIRYALEEAGVKSLPGDGVTAHVLRHTAASDVYERCGDLQVVQEMLGHSSLVTTQIYLRRASASKLRRAMNGRDYRR